MPSSYSPSLRVELQASGENDSTWGDKANGVFKNLEDAIAGITPVTMNDSDYTLTVAYGASDESRRAILVVSGGNSVTRNVIVPAVSKTYVVRNITSGGFPIVVKTQSGQGVTVKNGDTAFVYCDGANVVAISSGGSGSDGGVVPGSLTTAVSGWTLYGSLGINHTEAAQQGFGRFAVDGTAGAEYNIYYNGVLAGKQQVKTNTQGVAVGYDINSNGLPLSLSMSGTAALQVETDGTVDVAKTLTAASLKSTGDVVANGNITSASDERLKHEWAHLPVGYVDRLAAVKYGTYSRVDLNAQRRFAGISAQDMQKLLPETVETLPDGSLSVAYGNAAMVSVMELAKDFIKLRDVGIHMLNHAKVMQDELPLLHAEVAELKRKAE